MTVLTTAIEFVALSQIERMERARGYLRNLFRELVCDLNDFMTGSVWFKAELPVLRKPTTKESVGIGLGVIAQEYSVEETKGHIHNFQAFRSEEVFLHEFWEEIQFLAELFPDA